MRILVTGSAGHLGEALVRTIRNSGNEAVGTDLVASQFTNLVGSIVERDFATQCIDGIDAVIHSATLHKPHVASHSRQAFIDTNITGTLNLLEAAAEDLCQLFHRNHGLPCLVLRTSRFFPEQDDSPAIRESFAGDNAKANEFLFRRVDLEDAVSAHLCAVERAPEIGFGRYIISATTLLARQDLAELRTDAADVVGRRVARYEAVYRRRGWRMFAAIDRVYVNKKARDELGWRPVYDFGRIVDQLDGGDSMGSDLARQVGIKGYHAGPS